MIKTSGTAAQEIFHQEIVISTEVIEKTMDGTGLVLDIVEPIKKNRRYGELRQK